MRSIRWVSLVVLGALFAQSLHAQDALQPEDKIFAAVPVQQRARLAERLQEYIDYLLVNTSDLRMDLYDQQTRCLLCEGGPECTDPCVPPSELELPKDYRSETVAFRPKSILPTQEPGHYTIKALEIDRVDEHGRGHYRRKKRQVTVDAVYENGEWYFSLVTIPDGVVLM